MHRCSLLLGSLALLGLAACGSSGAKSTTSAISGVTTTSAISSGSTTSSAPASASTQPLPAPCTLLTRADVAPLFETATTALYARPTAGPASGTGQCAFGLSVGSQGMTVTIKTRTDYANDPSYIFPQGGTTVPGIGDLAVITSVQRSSGEITVRLGKDAIDIYVEFYTKPVDNAFLTTLARDAVGRV
jgi:hypothetical protein